jgi:hypothetical protein
MATEDKTAAPDPPLETSLADKRRRTAKTMATEDKTAAPDPKVLKTNDFRRLLPKRKTTAKPWNIYDISTKDDLVDGKDASRGATKKTTKSKSTTNAKAKATKNAWTRPLTRPPTKTPAKTPAKTYTKKPLDNSANEPIELGEKERNSELTPLPSSSSDPASTIEMADGVVGKAGIKKLKELKKKFKQVDQWQLEFEDVSQENSDLDKR